MCDCNYIYMPSYRCYFSQCLLAKWSSWIISKTSSWLWLMTQPDHEVIVIVYDNWLVTFRLSPTKPNMIVRRWDHAEFRWGLPKSITLFAIHVCPWSRIRGRVTMNTLEQNRTEKNFIATISFAVYNTNNLRDAQGKTQTLEAMTTNEIIDNTSDFRWQWNVPIPISTSTDW